MLDTSTPKCRAWLRRELLAYVRDHAWAAEDKIARHVETKIYAACDDYTLGGSDIEDMLCDLVIKDRVLDWRERRGKPDAPLRYALTALGRAEVSE